MAAVLEGNERVGDLPNGGGNGGCSSERPYKPDHWATATIDSDHVIALMSNPQIQIQHHQCPPPRGQLGSSLGGPASAPTAAAAIAATAAAAPQPPPPLPTFLMESDGWEVTKAMQRRPNTAWEKLGGRQGRQPRETEEEEEEEDLRVHMHKSGSQKNSPNVRPVSPGSTKKYRPSSEAVRGSTEVYQHARAARGCSRNGEGGRLVSHSRGGDSEEHPLAHAPGSRGSGTLPTDAPAGFLPLLASDVLVSPPQPHVALSDVSLRGSSNLLPANAMTPMQPPHAALGDVPLRGSRSCLLPVTAPLQPHSSRRGSCSYPQLPSPFSAASAAALVLPAGQGACLRQTTSPFSAAANQSIVALGTNTHQQQLQPRHSSGFRSSATLPSLLEVARESDSSSVLPERSDQHRRVALRARKSRRSTAASAAPAVDSVSAPASTAAVAAGRRHPAHPSAPAGRQHPVPQFPLPPPGHRLVYLDAAGGIIPVGRSPQLTGWQHAAAAAAYHPRHGMVLAGGLVRRGNHAAAAASSTAAIYSLPASALLPPTVAWASMLLQAPKPQVLMLAVCGLLVALNLTILSCCALAGLVAEEVRRAGRG